MFIRKARFTISISSTFEFSIRYKFSNFEIQNLFFKFSFRILEIFNWNLKIIKIANSRRSRFENSQNLNPGDRNLFLRDIPKSRRFFGSRNFSTHPYIEYFNPGDPGYTSKVTLKLTIIISLKMRPSTLPG